MAYFSLHRYQKNLYQIKDPLGVLITLVVGEKQALVFDTGYGIGDLKKYIRQITPLKLVVVASHGHFDHTGGNYQFPEVFIAQKDLALCLKYNSASWRRRNWERADALHLIPDAALKAEYLKKGAGNLKVITPGTEIDLGGITCLVVPLPGHTQGSIGILIKEWQLLLASDAICPVVWLFLKESTTLKKYLKTVSDTLNLDFTHFLVGHGAKMYTKKDMRSFYLAALHADSKKAKRVAFPGFASLPSYYYAEDGKDCGIVFNPLRMGRGMR